jgi:hypothetical protein
MFNFDQRTKKAAAAARGYLTTEAPEGYFFMFSF